MRLAHRSILVALALAPLAGLERTVRGDDPVAIRITAHDLEIRFDPSKHALVARDRVTVEARGPVAAGTPLACHLAPDVRVLGASGPDGAALEVKAGPDHRHDVVLPALAAGTTTLELRYAGTIFDAVQKKDQLAWVIGDETRGLISEKGIYLNGASGWYPRTEQDGVLRFDVTSYVPAPFLVVTQGRPPQRSVLQVDPAWASDEVVAPPAIAAQAVAPRAYHKSVALAEIPTDACDLVAGPYVETIREVKGIQVATYFLPGEAPDAGLWLDAAAEVVARYEPILGTYPHKKFDVVENFFSTGYGMPSFTLLGDDVIRYVTMGAKHTKKIPPGYLDHEYVHGWFGNGLFVDPRDGNWCEASTTYYSNYLAKELESAEAGVEHRRGTLEKYAIRISAESDYPVRKFAAKTEDKDNDIGYGKGSLIFHVLRRRLGDAEFFERVRRLCADRVGTNVSWDDWLRVLDGAWALPFLERKGLPAIRLASATAWPAGDGTWAVRAEAVVDQPRGEAAWPDVDLDVDVDGVKAGTLHLSGKSGVWRGIAKTPPKTVELDARYETMRAIAPGDLPPCLNRTIAAPGTQVVRIGGGEAFEGLAGRLAEQKHLEAIPEERAWKDGKPVILLQVVRAGEKLSPPADAGPTVTVDAAGVRIGDKSIEGKDLSILVSFLRKGVPETWFIATSDAAAAARAQAVPRYGWDQYVVFEGSKRTPVARGFLDRDPKGTKRAVVDDEAAARVSADVEQLASDAFAGRAPGTPGHDAARAWLSDRLEKLAGGGAGHLLAEQAFALGVADRTSSRDLTITTATGTEVLKDAFRPLWGSPARDAGKPLPFAQGTGAVPLPGRVPDTTPDGLARFWRQVEEGTAPAILVAPSPEARAALASFLDTPTSITEASQAELDKPGRDGKPRPHPSLPHWIQGRRLRAFPGAAALRVPVLVLEESAVAALEAKQPTAIDFAVTWGPPADALQRGLGGVNLYAWLPGSDAAASGSPPTVLVCAHYDSFGTQGGRVLRGADDNGSGVACVLEAVRGLPAKLVEAKAKRGLIVLLTDGEEWGLVGARAAASMLAGAYKLEAVVNVDSVGRVRDDTVFVLGRSVHPDLAAVAEKALGSAGLRPGADIDKYAYPEGSDHWPFHALGVPAIAFWASDYGVMNTPEDEPALVDPVGVARLAGALRATLWELLTR